LPNLVPEAELAPANGLLQGVENVSWAVGPLLGGVLTAAWGPHVAYWINAVSFVVSGVLVARIPQRLLQSTTALTKGWWQDVGDGWRAVRSSRELRAVLVAWTLAMAALGAVNVGEIFLAKNSFGAGDFGYGLLYGAIGVGLVVGSIGAGALVDRFGIRRLYGLSIGWMAVCFAGAAASPDVWVGATLAMLGGVGNGVAVLCNILLVQRGAADEVRGRALTVVMGVNYVMLGIASAVAGPVVDAVGARWLWAGAAGILLAAAVVGAAMTRGVRDTSEKPPVVPPLADPEVGVPLATGTAPPGI